MTPPSRQSSPLADLLDIPVHDFTPKHGLPRGRSVYLQGQLHANESAGMLVLHDLVRRLRAEAPPNRVRVVPNANPVGWSRYLASGQGRVSASGTNWNRMFGDLRPAQADPRQADNIDKALAATLWRLSEDFEVVIDVHTPEYGCAHLYAASPADRLLTMDDIPHVTYGAPGRGPFDESHLRLRDLRPAPLWASVTLEIPSHEMPTPSFVAHWSERLLKEVRAHAGRAERSGDPAAAGAIVDLVPGISGAVVLRCRPGGILPPGEPVLSVHGRKGEVEMITAPARCVPVCFRRATVVEAGYWVCRVIALQ